MPYEDSDMGNVKRTRAQDAREYRREHDLCKLKDSDYFYRWNAITNNVGFYCGRPSHTLRECGFAPHNRGKELQVVRRISSKSLRNNNGSNVSLAGTIPNENNSSPDPDSHLNVSGLYEALPHLNSAAFQISTRPKGKPRVDILLWDTYELTPPVGLCMTEYQWRECFNARLSPSETFDGLLQPLTLESTVGALKNYIAIRFPSQCPDGRSITPNLELDESQRHTVQYNVRIWEAVPEHLKAHAIAWLKKHNEERTMMLVCDKIGEKVMDGNAPREVVDAFQVIMDYCVPEDSDTSSPRGTP